MPGLGCMPGLRGWAYLAGLGYQALLGYDLSAFGFLVSVLQLFKLLNNSGFNLFGF